MHVGEEDHEEEEENMKKGEGEAAVG